MFPPILVEFTSYDKSSSNFSLLLAFWVVKTTGILCEYNISIQHILGGIQ